MDRFTFAAEYELDGNTLSGIVHVFGTRTKAPRGGVFHRFSADSFDPSSVVAYYAHDTSKPLARPELEVRDGKLHFSMELGNQTYAQDLRENRRLGLMNEMSFGVQPRKWKDTREKDGTITRDHTEAHWFDISPVTVGAFPDTGSQLHSDQPGDNRRELMARARARVSQEAYRG